MATRVAVMSMGKLQQVGTPQEVYSRPVNTFVAQFIGTPPMNCFPGKIAADGGRIEVAGGTLPLPAGLVAVPAAGSTITVGVRPEHLAVSPEGSLTVEVRAVEWLGHECLISAGVGDATLVVREVGMSASEGGNALRLAVDPANVHLFDPNTTLRIG